jgi:TolA-binding protein
MKKIAFIIAIVFLTSVSLYAGDSPEAEGGFWEKMLTKVNQIIPKKQVDAETSIAGIRGKSQEERESLYWKGEDPVVSVTEEELEAFKAAVRKALEGEREQALQLFEQFNEQFPKSALRIDAQKAISELRAATSRT